MEGDMVSPGGEMQGLWKTTVSPGGMQGLWSDSPLFWKSMGLFIVVYAIGYFLVFNKWKGRARFEAASCGMSLVHGTVAAVLATRDILTTEFRLDAPNTLMQDRIMEYSMAYFVVDLVNYMYAAPDDYLFIGHHICTFSYMLSCRHFTGHGATSVMCLIAAGEATSPLHNIWTLARMARKESPLAAKIYTSLSPFFTVYYTLLRGVLGPYLVWVLGKFYFAGKADAVVPRWLVYCWMFKIVFAIGGSFLWVYKLWTGLIKFYSTKDSRRRETAEAATSSLDEAAKKTS